MKQEIAIIPKKTLPMVVAKLPPRPVWTDQIGAFLEKSSFIFSGSVCKSREDFECLKTLSAEGVKFKKAIEASYVELTQAIDAIKQPILDQRKEDLFKVESKISAWDQAAITWLNEENRKAKEEAERKRKEEFERRQAEALKQQQEAEAKRQAELSLAKDWGDEETVQTLEAALLTMPEVQMPRETKVDTGLTYRKGARTKTKPVFEITDPDKVSREYCVPDPRIIAAKLANTFAVCSPTPELIAALEKEIGGGRCVWK